jgi:hypothetical protein
VIEALMTDRELNRAVLARQHLLDRADLSLDAAVEAVGALQAQYAPAPPVALWSRLRDLTLDGYASALRQRRLVTALLMRGTMHVVSAAEYWPIAAAVASLQNRSSSPIERSSPVDLVALRADLAGRVADVPVSQAEVTAYLRDWLFGHGHDPEDPEVAMLGRLAWRGVRGSTAVLNVQSRGAWGQRAPDAYVAARAVLPPPRSGGDEALSVLVRHHLRAFGPAAAEDVASWTGATGPAQLREALAALAPELLRFRDEAGRLLFDLADAPRPGTDVAAPVRYLPSFDSLLLAYAARFRERVLPEPYRPAVIRTANLQVLATFLVDGMVAGTWEVQVERKLAMLVVRPLGLLAREDRQPLIDEGERLVRFVKPLAGSHGVRIEHR